MFITEVKIKNLRNFRRAEVDRQDTAYLMGPNASGKLNSLDISGSCAILQIRIAMSYR